MACHRLQCSLLCLSVEGEKNRSIADVMANDNWIRDLMLGISAVLFIDYIMMWTLINYVPLDLSQQEEDVIV
jgi:hypothetical protein